MQGRKYYQEKLFTSFQLSDRVPEENIYRRILGLIDFQYLYEKTTAYYGKEGQSSIDPVVFFKLILVGYLENISSDRRIIQSCSMRMDILFFLGYDIDEPLPWHSTLSRTRKLYGEEVFLSLFQEVLLKCMDVGMLSGKRQAVDSMLIKANASLDSMQEKEILFDSEVFVNELEENQEIETENALSFEKGAYEKKRKTNKTHYSPADQDARIATKPGKPYQLNYLGQVSVDTGSCVITHAETFAADKRDSQCLEKVLVQTMKNLQKGGLTLDELLADTNYSSTASLELLKKTKIKGYIPNFGGYKPTREGFTYEAEEDRYKCSQGKYLIYKGIKNNHSPSKQYLSRIKDCKSCPIRSTCIGKSNQKMITETLSRPLFQEMEKRMKSIQGRHMRRLRQSTVEPVIGTMVEHLKMKKVLTKGLENANKSILMSGLAYNLRKLLKHTKFNRPNSIESSIKKVFKDFNPYIIDTYLLKF